MSTTQIKGNQILDGTIDSADISDSLEKDFTKVRTTENDLSPDFLYNKIIAGNNITLSTVGLSGTNQTLQIASTGGSSENSGWLINTSSLVVFTTSSISVSGDATIDGELFASSGIQISGDILELSGSLLVSGSADFDGDITSNGTLFVNEGLEISGNILTITGSFFITGSTEFLGTVKINGSEIPMNGWNTLWEADLTNNQTIQSWSSGTNYDVMGTNNVPLSWKFKQGADITSEMSAAGIKLNYPSSNLLGSNGNVSFSLNDLGLVGFGGRPWRVWIYYIPSGTITAGIDGLQVFVDLDGTSESNSAPQHFAKALDLTTASGGYTEVLTRNIGSDTASSDQAWGNLNVLCIEQVCGSISVKMGTYSNGFPSESSLYPFAGGSIAGQCGPYQMTSRITLRIEASGSSPVFSGRSWTIPHVLVEAL